MAENKEKLFDMFPPVSTEEWMAKINADLKGADFSKKLVWRTNEGFNVMPFYRKEDIEDLYTIGSLPGEFPFVRGTRDNNDWLIRQQILGETPQEINDHARHSIDRVNRNKALQGLQGFRPRNDSQRHRHLQD